MWGLVIATIIVLVLIVTAYAAYKTGTSFLCKIPIVGGVVCPGDDGLPSCKGDLDTDKCCKNVISQCTERCKANTNPNLCLYECAKQRDCADHLDCSDFGSFSTGLSNSTPCGDDAEGGATCKDDCCKAQATYCNGAAAGNSQKIQCMKDRKCDPAKYLSCSDFGTYAVDPGDSSTYCGTETQGGTTCQAACCAQQKSYCDSVSGNAQKYACMQQRGCDPDTYLDCSDFGTYAVVAGNKNTYCGTGIQGGDKCKSKCCAAQNSYCQGACLGNSGCVTQCLKDRGCTSSSGFRSRPEGLLSRVGHFVSSEL